MTRPHLASPVTPVSIGSHGETSPARKRAVDGQAQPRKRNKPSLVCSNCKRRKIKCDRRLPCSSCVKMKCGYECSYEPKWQPMSFEKGKESPHSHTSSSYIDSAENENENGSENLSISSNSKWSGVEVQATSEDPLAFENSSTIKPVVPSYISKDDTHEINPTGAPDETINFFEGYAPFHIKEPFRRVSYGPLSWASFMKKDPWLLVVWIYAQTEKTEFPCLLFAGPTEVTNENIKALNADRKSENPDIAFRKRALEIDGYEELAPLSSLEKHNSISEHASVPSTIKKEFKFDNESRLGQSTVTLGQSLFRGKINPELEVVSQFKAIIPKKKVAWSLMNHFFNHLYSTMPFLDEEDFKQKISLIIGPESMADTPVESVRVVNKLDLANLCILMIVLRLSYLSLFNNKNAINEKILKTNLASGEKSQPETEYLNYLMKHPINLSAIEVVKNTLHRFDIARKTNMTVFQCLLFVRLYHIYAPEEGDGHDGGDSRVSTAILIQMAMSLGLNRDPDNFPDIFRDERQNNLGRKMWWFLVREDLTSYLSIGNSPTISMKQYDTKAPFYKEGNANVNKIDLELATIQIYKWFITRIKDINRVVSMTSDVRGNTRVQELTEAITLLEKQANNEDTFDGPYIGIQTEVMMKTYASVRMKLFLFLKSSLISLVYHLYLYYEDKLNYELSFFYLKKLLNINLYYILPATFDVLCGKHSKNALTLNPILQLAMHKANQVNIAAGVRVGYLVYNLEASSDHESKLTSDVNYKLYFQELNNLYKGFVQCGGLYASTFAKLASKYYYAWRISKAHDVLFKILTTKRFYQGLPNNVRKMRSFQFNTPQLQELSKVMNHSKKWLDQIVDFEELQDTPVAYSIPTSLSSITASPPMSNSNVNQTSGYGQSNKENSSGILQNNGNMPANENPAFPTEDIDQMWLSMIAMRNQGDFQNGIFGGSQAYPQVGQGGAGQPFVPNQLSTQHTQSPIYEQDNSQVLNLVTKPEASQQGTFSYNEMYPSNRNTNIFDNEVTLDVLDNMLL
ncbi:multidrug resistance regulator 1 [[Candida] railenensis]|uniref:Multidrug resistance regulator 1 n=1 Tax=[Candida] railenensis TaxID=45579 RepID=A0A9P0W0A5_9ASCO|nr:multidrug resistance regulator 1 [[Candida] railenensis]